MTSVSLAADIIVSTFFFVLAMYGSIMGGSGEVKITATIDLNQAIGGSPPNREGQSAENSDKPINRPLQNQLLEL
jgi:hypothetical protein